MRHSLRTLLAVCAMCASAAAPAAGQEPQLVFTVAAPESAPAADTHVRASAVVAERGLALWGGSSSDFGLGVDVAARGWMVSSIESVGLLPLGSNEIDDRCRTRRSSLRHLRCRELVAGAPLTGRSSLHECCGDVTPRSDRSC